jgi:DnaA family protein
LRDDATLDNFLPQGPAGTNAVTALRALVDGGRSDCLYLSGPPGSGRSHLLQAACHLAFQSGRSNAYLPLGEIRDGLPAQALDGFENFTLLAVDDIDNIAGDADWEQSFFHLFNRAREAGQSLLLAATSPPGKLGLRLPDLVSRLSACLQLGLPRPDDAQLQRILVQRAERRGLQLPAEVATYVLQRAPRDPATLIGLLERLDAASLAAARRLTIPFVRETLGW